VIRTRVGYAGGAIENPTYHSLGDHTETIQIDFDPTQISYEKLLDVFWNSHNPAKRPWSRQYKAAVFYHNEEQKEMAMQSRDRVAASIKREIRTEIIPFSAFYLAEPYHQKYQLQHHGDFMREFRSMYPRTADFVSSTAAARVNGYLGGHGSFAQLQAELDSFGLSPTASEKLLATVKKRKR
jgi:peptide-methionine (S)-S-oxide reductase